MHLINSKQSSSHEKKQAAAILLDRLSVGWPTLKDAQEEVHSFANRDGELVFAVEDEKVVGLCGFLRNYPYAYEMHPLAVAKEYEGRGIGKLLLSHIESLAKQEGALTMYLGTDDELENTQTSLRDSDLYTNYVNHLSNFSPNNHPSRFYMQHGYHVLGAIPDANGKGKPDIYMGKKLQEESK